MYIYDYICSFTIIIKFNSIISSNHDSIIDEKISLFEPIQPFTN